MPHHHSCYIILATKSSWHTLHRGQPLHGLHHIEPRLCSGLWFCSLHFSKFSFDGIRLCNCMHYRYVCMYSCFRA